MSTPSYLLFIDKTPVTNDLITYFAQFNIVITQQYTLKPMTEKPQRPLAILIHWSLLKQELHIINELYTSYPVPLIIINDYSDEEACIKVLEAGADDFIVTPIYPRELHARVSAISRRVLRAQNHLEQEKEIHIFHQWRLYPSSRRIFNEHSGEELFLSAGEYDLLLAFILQPQRVLDRELLLHITKNGDLNPLDRRVDVQISRLRQKIEPDVKRPTLIKTIRNSGYMFTAPVTTVKETEYNR